MYKIIYMINFFFDQYFENGEIHYEINKFFNKPNIKLFTNINVFIIGFKK